MIVIHTYVSFLLKQETGRNKVLHWLGGVWCTEYKFSSRIEGALSQFFRDVGIDVRSRMGEGWACDDGVV
jgi:hypothetical protein